MTNKQPKITEEEIVIEKVIEAAKDADEKRKKSINRGRKLKYYKVSYRPDLTEGRGFKEHGVLTIGARDNHSMFAEHWCFDNFGNRIAFIMGVYNDAAITENWRIKELYPYEVDNYKKLETFGV